jgi:hypothetical protein
MNIFAAACKTGGGFSLASAGIFSPVFSRKQKSCIIQIKELCALLGAERTIDE